MGVEIKIITIVAAIIATVTIFIGLCGLHTIKEGYVGVYYRAGALLPTTSQPGLHFKLPLITEHKSVQVTLQTDELHNVPCGTSGGVMLYFGRVEVVNILQADAVLDIVKKYTVDYDRSLIFDKIHHELNQFCSKHTMQQVFIDLFGDIDDNLKNSLQKSVTELAPGLKVLSVRVTKPRIPDAIKFNYEAMERQKTELLIVAAHQAVVEKNAETQRKKEVIEAEKAKEVAQVQNTQKIQLLETQKTLADIENKIRLEKLTMEADNEYYRIKKLAEANNELHTKAFVDLAKYEALSKNLKIFFGEKIPTIFTSTAFGSVNNFNSTQ